MLKRHELTTTSKSVAVAAPCTQRASLHVRLSELVELQAGLCHRVHDRCIVNRLDTDAFLSRAQQQVVVRRGAARGQEMGRVA